MAKARLLHAVCTVAMLAAVPAFAQSNNSPDQTGGMPQPPAGQAASPGTAPAMPNSNGSMNMGTSGDQGTVHHSAMTRHHRQMMQSRRTDTTSGDAAVDRLNDQSLRAAQQGQTFDSASSGSMSGGGGMSSGSSSGMGSGSSGGMNSMSSGSTGMSGSPGMAMPGAGSGATSSPGGGGGAGSGAGK